MRKILLPLLCTFISFINFKELRSQTLPDLFINDLRSYDSIFDPGQFINFSYKIHNSGSAKSTFSYTGFYISTDQIIDNSDLFLSYTYANPIKTGDSLYTYYYAYLPNSISNGNYFLLLKTDYNSLVTEISESNNTASFPFTIGPKNIELKLLPVVSPLKMVPEQNKNVKCEVSNSGASNANTDMVCFLSQDSILGPEDVQVGSYYYYINYYNFNIPKHSSAIANFNITIPRNTSPGLYYLLYKTDSRNTINEQNETDNIRKYPIAIVTQNADLDVVSEQVVPSIVAQGGNCTINFDVLNRGNTPVSVGMTEVYFYISKDTLLDQTDIEFYYPYSSNATVVPLNDSNPVHMSVVKTIKPEIAPGNYYMLIAADQYNVINETNNANNLGYCPFTIAPLSGSIASNDIEMLDLNYTAAIIAPGRSIDISAKAYRPEYSYNHISYYLSLDTLVDANDVSLNTGYLYYSSSDTSTSTTNSIIPWDLHAGSYYLIAVIMDAKNDSDLSNNSMYKPITVLAADFDLQLNAKEISSVNLSRGSAATVSVEAYNRSTGRPPSFQMSYYLSNDTVLSSDDINLSLPYYYSYYFSSYNSSDTIKIENVLNIPSNAPYGNQYLLCQIDSKNFIPEINENNNVRSFPVNIGNPVVDFAFYSPSVISLNSYIPNSTIYFEENIVNLGPSSTVPVNVSYYYSLDSIFDNSDIYLKSELMAGISGNGNYFHHVGLWSNYNSTNGYFYIISYIDKYNNISETNENNNINFVKVQSAQLQNVDVTINTLLLNKNADILRSPVDITSEVFNNGTAPSGNFRISYYLSSDSIYSSNDILLMDGSFYSINPGSSSLITSSLNFSYSTLPGNYYIIAFADSNNGIAESNENNNIRAVPYTILPSTIDYTIESLVITPSSVVSGHCTRPGYNILHSGSSPVSYNPPVTCFLSTDTISSFDDVDLQYSNYLNSILIPSSIPTGNYYLLFIIDKGNYINELNETNNMAWVPIGIQKQPLDYDLIISSASIDSIAHPGEDLPLNYSVDNRGSTPIANTIGTGFYLSTDSVWGEADINLQPISHSYYYSSERFLKIPLETLPGNYYIIFFADNRSVYGETNEFNNTKSLPITITSPDIDLTIEQPIDIPDTLVTNSMIDISFNIKNNGTNSTPRFGSSVYLSADSLFDQTDLLIGNTYSQEINAHDLSTASVTLYLKNEIVPGQYYLIINADQYDNYGTPQSAVNESNENNNSFVQPVIVRRARIDITFRNISSPVTSTLSNTVLPIEYQTVNLGSDHSQAMDLKYFLSKDSVLSNFDFSLGSSYNQTYPLDGYEQMNTSISLSIPNMGTGDYYIIIQADKDQRCTELNENNNIVSYRIHIIDPGNDPSLSNIDLDVRSVNAAASITTGSQFFVSSTTYNLGTSNSTNGFVEYYLSEDTVLSNSDRYLHNTWYGVIYANGSFSKNEQLYMPATVDTGNFYLILRAEAYYSYDMNWNNNLKFVPIHIGRSINQVTDLSISGNIINPGIIYPGNSIAFKSVVKNQGSAQTTFYANYYLSKDKILDEYRDFRLTAETYNPINSQDSILQTPTLNVGMIVPGNYYLIPDVRTNYPVIDADSSNNLQLIPVLISEPVNDLSNKKVVIVK